MSKAQTPIIAANTLLTKRACSAFFQTHSRAYMAGTGGFDQITLDHSVVQAMVEKGQLTQSEARNHPRKHFLTRALGVEEDVECDFTAVDFSGDDLLLLCTDGLTNMVETDDIYAVIRASSRTIGTKRARTIVLPPYFS